jgi:hypothetical protein
VSTILALGVRPSAGGVDTVLAGDRLELRQRLERRLPQAFVALDAMRRARGLALLIEVGCVDRDDLGAEAVLGPRLGRQLLAAQPELVGVLAADAPLLGDALGPLELRGELVLGEVGLGDRHAQAQLPRRVDAERDQAHRLDAARHGRVDDTGTDQGRSQVRRLLGRSAL